MCVYGCNFSNRIGFILKFIVLNNNNTDNVHKSMSFIHELQLNPKRVDVNILDSFIL